MAIHMHIFNKKLVILSVLTAIFSVIGVASHYLNRMNKSEIFDDIAVHNIQHTIEPRKNHNVDSTLNSASNSSSAQIKVDTAEKSKVEQQEDDEIILELTERDLIVATWEAQHSPPEPNDNNYDTAYDSPFLAEVDLYNQDDECAENCADALQELLPAKGEYADQINSGALAQLSILEGTVDQSEQIPLVQPDPSSAPPTDED